MATLFIKIGRFIIFGISCFILFPIFIIGALRYGVKFKDAIRLYNKAMGHIYTEYINKIRALNLYDYDDISDDMVEKLQPMIDELDYL